MSVRSRQREVARPINDADVPTTPPSYDSIYLTSAPYMPMRAEVKRPLSEILTSPGRHERASRPLSDVLSLSSAGSRRSYVSSSRLSVAETSFVEQNSRSSVRPIDASRVNNESNTQQAPASRRKSSGLICIRIVPGEGGRYGFRVRGGADLSRPITVGRVIPQGPADACDPKPRPGDQILFINGVEVSNSTHEEVVKLIRSSHETVGELFLVVKREDPRDDGTGHTEDIDKQRRPLLKTFTEQTDIQYHFLGEY